MKKRWMFISGGSIILIVFIILALTSGRNKGTKVTVEEASKGDITSIVTATGKVRAQSDVQISADIMGRIEQLPITEGDEVKKGQLLVKIDSRAREMDVARAEGALLSSKSSMEIARLSWQREKELFSKGLSSQARLDEAASRFEQAEAQVQIAQADLDRSQDQLEKCTIRSPMDGIVTQLNSEEGENVVIGTMNSPGTVIMVISDLSAIEIEAEVDETDVAWVGIGQGVKIDLDAFPDTSYSGQVIQVGNSAQLSTIGFSDQVTNFMVKILIMDHVPNIKPGMTASVDITVASEDQIIKVPSGAVVMRPEGTEKQDIDEYRKKSKKRKKRLILGREEKQVDGVFVVKESRVRFVPVKTGISDQQFIQIESGLSEGDSVVTGPYRTLRTIKHGQFIEAEEPKYGIEDEGRRKVSVS